MRYFKCAVKSTHNTGYVLLCKAEDKEDAINKINLEYPDYKVEDIYEVNLGPIEKLQFGFKSIQIVDDVTFGNNGTYFRFDGTPISQGYKESL